MEDYYELTFKDSVLNETDLRFIIEGLNEDIKLNVRGVDGFLTPLYLTPPHSEYDFIQLNYLTIVLGTLEQTVKMKFDIV